MKLSCITTSACQKRCLNLLCPGLKTIQPHTFALALRPFRSKWKKLIRRAKKIGSDGLWRSCAKALIGLADTLIIFSNIFQKNVLFLDYEAVDVIFSKKFIPPNF